MDERPDLRVDAQKSVIYGRTRYRASEEQLSLFCIWRLCAEHHVQFGFMPL